MWGICEEIPVQIWSKQRIIPFSFPSNSLCISASLSTFEAQMIKARGSSIINNPEYPCSPMTLYLELNEQDCVFVQNIIQYKLWQFTCKCNVLWTAKVRDWQNPFPHSWHLNGFSLEWMYLENKREWIRMDLLGHASTRRTSTTTSHMHTLKNKSSKRVFSNISGSPKNDFFFSVKNSLPL